MATTAARVLALCAVGSVCCQHTNTHKSSDEQVHRYHGRAVCCSVLQCVAVCCSVLQCVDPSHGVRVS